MIANKLPEPPTDSRGKPFKCSMPRHLKSLRLQAAWFHIARMARVASVEKENKDKPPDKWKRPIFYGGIATLASQANCSINTARDLIHQLVKVGALLPLGEMGRSERGKFQSLDYEVTLHDHYCKFQSCPPFRFQRIQGHIRTVKKGLHKAEPERVFRFYETSSVTRNLETIRRQTSGVGPSPET